MLSSILVVAAIGALIFGVKRWQSLPSEQKAGFARKWAMYGAAAVILALVVTGKAHWLMGVLASLLALAGRVSQFAQYAPLFKQFMGDESGPEPEHSSGKGPIASNSQAMSKQYAAEVLGIEADASAEDVRSAHKRLIQKMHPDRGGSDALAKQINLAKDVLLS